MLAQAAVSGATVHGCLPRRRFGASWGRARAVLLKPRADASALGSRGSTPLPRCLLYTSSTSLFFLLGSTFRGSLHFDGLALDASSSSSGGATPAPAGRLSGRVVFVRLRSARISPCRHPRERCTRIYSTPRPGARATTPIPPRAGLRLRLPRTAAPWAARTRRPRSRTPRALTCGRNGRGSRVADARGEITSRRPRLRGGDDHGLSRHMARLSRTRPEVVWRLEKASTPADPRRARSRRIRSSATIRKRSPPIPAVDRRRRQAATGDYRFASPAAPIDQQADDSAARRGVRS